MSNYLSNLSIKPAFYEALIVIVAEGKYSSIFCIILLFITKWQENFNDTNSCWFYFISFKYLRHIFLKDMAFL